MRNIIMLVAVLAMAGLVYAGQIEVKQDKDGRVSGWNMNDFGQSSLSADQTVKLYPYNKEPFDRLEVDGEGKLVFILHPTPVPTPDLYALYQALEARVTELEK